MKVYIIKENEIIRMVTTSEEIAKAIEKSFFYLNLTIQLHEVVE